MLHSKRRELNRQIATVLELQFPGIAETQPELIAHHLTEALLFEPAIRWWHRAGQRNLHASANIEAIGQFERCLALLDNLSAGRECDLLELDIRIDLAVPLMGTCGYTAPEFRNNVDRALALCELTSEPTRLFPALWGQVARTFSAGEVDVSHALARRFLQSAERQGNRQLRMIGHRLCGMTLYGCGELPMARHHTERSLELYDPRRDPELRDVYGFDQRVAALAYLARTVHQLGFPDQAITISERAIAEARKFDHVNTSIYALGCMLELRIMRRELSAVAESTTELARLAEQHAAQNYKVVSFTCTRILALMNGGGGFALMTDIRDGIARLRELNWNYWATRLCLLAAEQAALNGQKVAAREWLAEARLLVDSLHQTFCLPDVHRVEGLVLEAEASCPALVGVALRCAIEAARDQSASWTELRCSAALARLLRDDGRTEEAIALIRPVLAKFTEGAELPDIVEARQLAASLC